MGRQASPPHLGGLAPSLVRSTGRAGQSVPHKTLTQPQPCDRFSLRTKRERSLCETKFPPRCACGEKHRPGRASLVSSHPHPLGLLINLWASLIFPCRRMLMRAQPDKAKQAPRVRKQDLFTCPPTTPRPHPVIFFRSLEYRAVPGDPQIFLLKTFVCLKRRFC